MVPNGEFEIIHFDLLTVAVCCSPRSAVARLDDEVCCYLVEDADRFGQGFRVVAEGVQEVSDWSEACF